MNIFIGNLSREIEERDLQKIFRPYGLLKSVKIGKDLGTGRTTGCAEVEMFSESEGLEAVKCLNNLSFLGKRLMVNQRSM